MEVTLMQMLEARKQTVSDLRRCCADLRQKPNPQRSPITEKTASILEAAIQEEACQTAARLAWQALLYEVATTPKRRWKH